MVTVMCGVTEQSQGTEAVFAQIAASALGVHARQVPSHNRDTAVTLTRSTWALARRWHRRRGGAAHGRALRSNVLDVASRFSRPRRRTGIPQQTR